MKKKIWRIIFLAFLLLGFLLSKGVVLSAKPVFAQSCQNSVGDNFSNLDKWSIRIKPDGSLQNKIETVSNYEGKPAVKHTLADPSGSTFMTYTLCQPSFGKVSIDFYDDGTDKGTLFVIYPQEPDFNRMDDPLYKPEVMGVGVWTGQDAWIHKETDNCPVSDQCPSGCKRLTYPSYVYRVNNHFSPENSTIMTGIKRKVGWHKFELLATPVGAFAKIDGNNLVSLQGKKHAEGFTYNVNTDEAFLTNGVKTIGIISSWNKASENYYANLGFSDLPQFSYTNTNESLSRLAFEISKYYFNQYPHSETANYYGMEMDEGYGNNYTHPLELAIIRAYEYRLTQNEDSLRKAKELFNYTNNGYYVYKHMNTTSYVMQQLIFAAQLLWDKLDNNTRNQVVNNLLDNARFQMNLDFTADYGTRTSFGTVSQHLPFQRNIYLRDPAHSNQVTGAGYLDGATRDNAWMAGFFYQLANFAPVKSRYPQEAAEFLDFSKTLAYHSLIRADNSSYALTPSADPAYGIHPVFPAEGVINPVPNMTKDYDVSTLFSCPNPIYTYTTMQLIARGLLLGGKTSYADDEADAYFHNWQPVLERSKNFIDFQTFRVKSESEVRSQPGFKNFVYYPDGQYSDPPNYNPINPNPCDDPPNMKYSSSYDLYGKGFQNEDFSHDVDSITSFALLPADKTKIDSGFYRQKLFELLRYEFYTLDGWPQFPFFQRGWEEYPDFIDNYQTSRDFTSLILERLACCEDERKAWGERVGVDGSDGRIPYATFYQGSARFNMILNGVNAVDHLYAAYYLNPNAITLSPLTWNNDLNQDSRVNNQDLKVVLANWGATSGAADLNNDGLVNGFDYGSLQKNLQTETCFDGDQKCPQGCSNFNDSDCPLFSDNFEVKTNPNFDNGLKNWGLYGVDKNKLPEEKEVRLITDQFHSGSRSVALEYKDKYVMMTHGLEPETNVVLRGWFYDNMSGTLGNLFAAEDRAGKQTGLGVKTDFSADHYYLRHNDASHLYDTKITRSPGWHQFELLVKSNGTQAKIDGQLISGYTNTEQTTLSLIKIVSSWGLTGNSYYDDIEVVKLP